MAKSREERIAKALGGTYKPELHDEYDFQYRVALWEFPDGREISENELKQTKFAPLEWQARIRQRVRELLDESGLYYSHKRDPEKGGRHRIEIVNPDYPDPVWYSGPFADSELPEKEQDLLLWLVGKGEDNG